MKEIRGWEEIIIETKDGELIVDITAENYIAKDGYNIRLVPCEDEKTTIDVAEVVRCKDCIHRYVTGIEALKAEPAEHGRWTVTETDDGEGGEAPHLICSECKSEPMAWSSKRFFNYCPNCGAKMDKGGEDE